MKLIPESEGLAFGLADGIICILSLVVGVASATSNPSLVVIAGLVGGMGDAFSNAIGFYISQSVERGVQLHASREHGVSMRVHSRREVFMSGLLSFTSTIAMALMLLTPFLFLQFPSALLASLSLAAALLFALGFYTGKLSGENAVRTALSYVALGIVGAALCFLIGAVLKSAL
jgi:predicted membrane protein (TIGR00267 family)